MTIKSNASANASKSPYEIRLTILQMAQDYMQSQTAMQLDLAHKMADYLIATQKATLEDITKVMPISHSIDDVLKKATQLYSFVLKKD